MSLSTTLAKAAKPYSPLSSPTTVLRAPKLGQNTTPNPKKKTTTTTAQQIATNPYDSFLQPNPYDPSKIDTLAQQGYAQDAAAARQNASAGYLTPEQIDAQAQNRIAQEGALSTSLAQRLGQIQQASVNTGNALGAGLGAQDTASQADANRIAGVAGAPVSAPATAPVGLGALLGSQTAAGANVYGALGAAALEGGNVASQKALDAATTLKQTNQADQAKTLAGFLQSLATPSARAATMTQANTQVGSANKATELSVWTGLETRRQQAAIEGDKKSEAAAELAEKKLEANMSSADRRYVSDQSAATSTANNERTTNASTRNADLAAKTRKDVANIAAKAKAAGKTNGLTPAQAAAWSKGIIAIRNQKSGSKVNEATTYSITFQPPTPTGPGGVVLPNSKPPAAKTIPVSAADYASGAYKAKLPKGSKVIGEAPAKTQAKTVNAASEWTRYKEALSYTQSTHPKWSRTQAVQALAQAGWPAPKSGGK